MTRPECSQKPHLRQWIEFVNRKLTTRNEDSLPILIVQGQCRTLLLIVSKLKCDSTVIILYPYTVRFEMKVLAFSAVELAGVVGLHGSLGVQQQDCLAS